MLSIRSLTGRLLSQQRWTTGLRSMAGSSFPSLVAPVNLSTDLGRESHLRTTSCLRIADHSLNAIDATTFLPTNNQNVDLFCVSQACITYPVVNLKERLQKKRTFSGTVIPVESEMWIESLGNTSLTFGHLIRFEDEILALMTRIYVRTNVTTGELIKVSDTERITHPATPRNVTLPQVTKLEAPSESDMQPLFEVLIGPQHCNNNHVDHAALADLLLQGMHVQGHSHENQKLSVRYLAPAELNQTLSVCIHKEKPLAALYKDGLSTPLAIAQVEPPGKANL